MRNAGLALALVASAQLTLLSSPAFAQDDSSKAAAQAPSETSTESTSSSSSGQDAKQKEKTGWIVLAAGGVGFVTGVVFDIVGGFAKSVESDGQSISNDRPAWVFAGTTLIVAGLAAGVYGGSMIISARKGTDQTNTPPPKDDASTDSVTKAAQARAASAPSFVVPLLSGKF
ncbi:MAG TPA: hypothetical protein VF765_06210 [Polyangiaceae bacterium]